MKRAFYILIVGFALSLGLFSCEEGSVGSVLSQNSVSVVKDSTFVLSGTSTYNTKVQSRTIKQLLGVIKANNYGELRSDFVSQFMPSLNLDTTGVTVNSIDSVVLVMSITKGSGYVGDSLVPMRASVYALNKKLPSPIYSNFNPSDYYSKTDLMGSTSYTASAIGLSDSIQALSYRQIRVKMPLEWGKNFFNEYKKNPLIFSSPTSFADYFPGVYVTTTYGNGRVMNIENTSMSFYYRQTETIDDSDTTYYKVIDYLATTPEVITNSNINLQISSNIKNAIAEGQTIIQAPAGLDVDINFPTQSVIDKFLNAKGENKLGVLNNVYLQIPAEKIDNSSEIDIPQYLLLVKASEKDEFFSKNSVTNNVSSYYASYDQSSKSYIFSDLREYILDIINNSNGVATADDAKLILTPVSIETETNSSTGSTNVVSVSPYANGPAIAKIDLSKAKLRITYSILNKDVD